MRRPVAFPPCRLELGLGLLSIGRVWGIGRSEPPDEAATHALLVAAIECGIRVFDTAPAYAASEARLGSFLRTLAPAIRSGLVIMTKAGEHWDREAGTSFIDHGRDALCRSIDRSLELLGPIDVLQIHKATADVVRHPDVTAALEHARRCGIAQFGASVADEEAGLAALDTGLFDALQFPFNAASRTLSPLLPALRRASATPILNRPFAMGGLVTGAADESAARAAFRFIAEHVEQGIVLSGTGKATHLRENMAAFEGAVRAEALPAPSDPSCKS